MQSSFKIIKSDMVMPVGNKEITTNFDNINNENVESNQDVQENEISVEEKLQEIISSAETKAESIIENALSRSAETLLKANTEAVEIEKNAYEKGYSEGSLKGYNEAYESTTLKGQQEAAAIINNANQILFSAKQEYEKYLEDKKTDILNMAISMAEAVLKRELALPDGLNEVLQEVLENSRNMTSCIIRASEVHCKEIRSNIDSLKESNAIKCEIFIIPDEEIGSYDAVIEKNNGRVEIGLGAGMEGIKKALL